MSEYTKSIDKILEGLATIGTALMEQSNEKTFQSEYFKAKEILEDIETELMNIEIKPKIKKGLLELVRYFNTKIDRRMKAAQDSWQ